MSRRIVTEAKCDVCGKIERDELGVSDDYMRLPLPPGWVVITRPDECSPDLSLDICSAACLVGADVALEEAADARAAALARGDLRLLPMGDPRWVQP